MAVDLQVALKCALFHARCDHTDHPDDAQNVVRVFVGDENVMDMVQIHLHLVENFQDSIAPSGVHHEIFVPVPQREAGVVAVDGLGVSCTEYIELFHCVSSILKIIIDSQKM